MRRGKIVIEGHAVDRFRERWSDSAHLDDYTIRAMLTKQVDRALGSKDLVYVPPGWYLPISYMGQDGYAVLSRGRVQTVLPATWCPYIEGIRKQHGKT